MAGACEGGRQRTAMILAAAAGITFCLLMCTVSSRLCAESWDARSIRLVSYTTRTTHIAANSDTSLRLCSGRSRLNATAAAAKRTYQQFLLDDAARRHGDVQHAAWAGDAVMRPGTLAAPHTLAVRMAADGRTTGTPHRTHLAHTVYLSEPPGSQAMPVPGWRTHVGTTSRRCLLLGRMWAIGSTCLSGGSTAYSAAARSRKSTSEVRLRAGIGRVYARVFRAGQQAVRNKHELHCTLKKLTAWLTPQAI